MIKMIENVTDKISTVQQNYVRHGCDFKFTCSNSHIM